MLTKLRCFLFFNRAHLSVSDCTKDFPGGYSEEVTPVPIPNTAVKLFSADDTDTFGKVGRYLGF